MQKNHCRRNKYDWSLLYLEYIYSGCASILLNAYVHFNWDAFVLKKPKMSCLSHHPPPSATQLGNKPENFCRDHLFALVFVFLSFFQILSSAAMPIKIRTINIGASRATTTLY